jgi:nucleoside 2-deoxyribosyltransferase
MVLENMIQQRAINNSRLSHALRLRYDAQPRPPPFLRQDSALQPYQQDRSHIPPQEQLDNLILWIGRNQPSPHEWVESDMHALGARIGASIGADSSEGGVSWLLSEFSHLELFNMKRGNPNPKFRLRPHGWVRFGELNRRIVNSRTAFMAMKYGDATLDSALRECFQPAAARAGFTLRALNEQPYAGLIDNQIRAAIRASRFVIADLSHDNNGAYFEAGFAEGLGLPVIYTCEARKFEARTTHFDTNHMHTVKWDGTSLTEAGKMLTATIRNTLPLESKLDD